MDCPGFVSWQKWKSFLISKSPIQLVRMCGAIPLRPIYDFVACTGISWLTYAHQWTIFRDSRFSERCGWVFRPSAVSLVGHWVSGASYYTRETQTERFVRRHIYNGWLITTACTTSPYNIYASLRFPYQTSGVPMARSLSQPRLYYKRKYLTQIGIFFE